MESQTYLSKVDKNIIHNLFKNKPNKKECINWLTNNNVIFESGFVLALIVKNWIKENELHYNKE